MLTKKMCLKRQRRLWDSLPKEIEWVIVGNPKHVYYMCGFLISPISFSSCEKSFLLLERRGMSSLIVDSFSLSSAESGFYVDDIIEVEWYDRIHSVQNRTILVCEALSETVKKLPLERGCAEREWIPTCIGIPENLDKPLSDIILLLRRQKEPDEIRIIKRISDASTAGHNRALEIIGPGISEMDIYREVNNAVLERLGVPAIVYGDFRAVNADSPFIGGLPTTYRCQQGDLFIMDYSIVLYGYRTDCTNTIAVGKMSDDQRHFFNVCLEALYEVEKFLVPGMVACEIFSVMYKLFKMYNLEAEFGRHAGHGIGLSHPEAPCFGPESDEIVMKSEIVTLEPGVYKKGVGGVRIERNYLVTDKGPILLTGHALSPGG